VQLFAGETPAAAVVEIAPGQGSPKLKIDNQEVPLGALQHKPEELLQNRPDRVVAIKPGNVPFADVVHVVDVCNMSGVASALVLQGPEL
jgi:biopolymer transport protein ExbD